MGIMSLPGERRAGYALRSDDVFNIDDELVNALLETREMRRLKKIGFLGAIDFIRKGSGRQPHRRRHNRFEHSLGVAKLAETYIQKRAISKNERRLILAAALLHDVGHGPLSHTLEPVFEEEFGVNHHFMTKCIIRGETRLGRGVMNTLKAYSIDPEEVIALIEGRHSSTLNFLFASPINLDTLEGISRCLAFFQRRSAFAPPCRMVVHMAYSDELPTTVLDGFWRLKHHIYNMCISAHIGLIMDLIARAYMQDNISGFTEQDFLSTEVEMRKRHQSMFKSFEKAASKSEKPFEKLSKDLLNVKLSFKKRRFYVDEAEPLNNIEAMSRRYLQSKETFTARLGEIIGSGAWMPEDSGGSSFG